MSAYNFAATEHDTNMGKIRDRARTRERILDAAAVEFADHGFDAATVSGIARRSKLSKQLISHHFGNKEQLFLALHNARFRPRLENREMVPAAAAELLAERFEKHAGDTEYIRFLTWEAAGGRTRNLPGHATRRRRIADYGAAIRKMRRTGQLPSDLNPRLIHLAALALATYPMAFGQITRLVTGRSSSDPVFRRQWSKFLREIGVRLFNGGRE